jgi:hypothetical protein
VHLLIHLGPPFHVPSLSKSSVGEAGILYTQHCWYIIYTTLLYIYIVHLHIFQVRKRVLSAVLEGNTAKKILVALPVDDRPKIRQIEKFRQRHKHNTDPRPAVVIPDARDWQYNTYRFLHSFSVPQICLIFKEFIYGFQ